MEMTRVEIQNSIFIARFLSVVFGLRLICVYFISFKLVCVSVSFCVFLFILCFFCIFCLG